jgi:D-galactarolactone cycloisomerase
MGNNNSINELGYHIIENIRSMRVRNRYPRLLGKNSQRVEHGYGEEFIIKQLRTNHGATGWGIYTVGYPPLFSIDIEGIIDDDQHIIGKNLAELFDPAIGVTKPFAEKYEFALHDLAGNILKMPVFRMIGDDGVNPVPCYDGGILFDDLSPDENPGGLKKILEECAIDYDMGYRGFKLKIGRGKRWMDPVAGLKRDIAVTRMVRERYPQCRLMVDANDAYTPETIKPYIEGVSDCDLYWIEEPFREDEESLKALREILAKYSPKTMIADGESNPDVNQLLDLHSKKLLDILQMDIEYYGLTAWRRLLPTIRKRNIRISPHNWGFKVKTHYSAALAAALPFVDEIEGVIDETEGIDFSGYKMFDGKLTVPDTPGFGMKLIFAQELQSLKSWSEKLKG